jgi:sterol desaturase/sphingolipid hydroxylase (fatty acid hydroxylase superfamily)
MSFESLIYFFEASPLMIYVFYASLAMMGITILEIIVDYFTDRERDWKDTLVNVATGISKEILARTIIGAIAVIGLYVVYVFIPWSIPHTWWTWILAVLAADLTYYWMHRFEHRIRILWAHHSVHHSSENYNLTVGYRLSWFEDIIEWIFLIPMVLIGFSVPQTVAGLIIVAVYQHWVHTEKIGKLGWFDIIFNTPSVHRVHHGSNSQYLDKNYGGVLMIWDHMFGTFEPEGEKVKYGLTKKLDTHNIFYVHIAEYQNILRDLVKAKSWKDRWMLVFGPPGRKREVTNGEN